MARIEDIESRLDSFDAGQRREAIEEICEKVSRGQIVLPEAGAEVNLHCHTFFSYNCYGYSPSKIAWLARKRGLAVAGIVDFEVLDGAGEFFEAARRIGLKAVAGIETRVYVGQFGNRVINSPGEPGVSYHMGMGFVSANLNGGLKEFQLRLQGTAQQRNSELTHRVNKYLSPVELDYTEDVLPLTPAGNATERHICLAYARKAKVIFNDNTKLEKFWSEKLEADARGLGLPEGQKLLNAIRSKTMKWGGVGYISPVIEISKSAGKMPATPFAEMGEMDRFTLAAGAMPTMTWLDGTSDGEQALEELIDMAMKSGVVAFNVIPDRNFTAGAGEPDLKFKNLKRAIEIADGRGLAIVCGTEMNSPGQKFVDDFKTKELSQFVPLFLKGAFIVYAHTALQRQCGLGYTSEWAKRNFKSISEKNEFFSKVGERLAPSRENMLVGFDDRAKPEQILAKIKS